ncbi:DUF3037 domain-containing protein [Flavobacterium silvaticum]|uniref:DUF3037 domain-containing protein n=1 Tax=Flavobacterium silvaticum TaxID=1852020 RepID=A0A972FKJ4_9FLAO|nr:DUF3037 domain-containing protein [Flavobacterium silvaticum]NMH27377.1 DUF3037 domain-containing protein [Flavobacterium silvaticum]
MTPELHVYEYAVIRVVPSPEREEFLNAGVILFCKRKKFLKAICKLDTNRFEAAFPNCDCETEVIRKNLESIVKIADGEKNSGPIAAMELSERFRWLTAVRSTIIQSSRPHPGLTDDPEATLRNLMTNLA